MSKSILLAIACTLAPAAAYPQTTEQLFPYSVQSHEADGHVTMRSGSRVFGKSAYQGELNFKQGTFQNNGNRAVCFDPRYRCQVPSLFKPTPRLREEFSAIKEDLGNQLKERSESKLKGDDILDEGAHWFEKGLDINNHVLGINGDGLVSVYIAGDLTINPQGRLGAPEKQHKLNVYVDGDVTVKGRFYGNLYATGDVTLQTPHNGFCGALSSRHLTMLAGAVVNGCTPVAEEEPKFELTGEAGYVDGLARLTILDGSSDPSYALFTVSHDGGGRLLYVDEDDAEHEMAGALYLPVNQPIPVKYDQAERINLSLTVASQTEVPTYSTELVFVPKALKWRHDGGLACHDERGFVYAFHHQGCPILARAGEDVNMTLVAYSATGRAIPYRGDAMDLEILLLNDALEVQQRQVQVNMVTSGETFGSASAIEQVGLIKTRVPSHCAAYARQGDDCPLETAGDEAVLGRTIPAELVVTGTEPGRLVNNFAYAGRDALFAARPAFEIAARDRAGRLLPSYRGEFARGLEQAELLLDIEGGDGSVTVEPYLEPVLGEQGRHRLQLREDRLAIGKDATPFNARTLDEQLRLDSLHLPGDGGVALDDPASVALAPSAWLRYGRMGIGDLSLNSAQAGQMPVALYYYDEDGALQEDDEAGGLLDQAVLDVAAITEEPQLPSLTAEEEHIAVAAYEGRGDFRVTAEVTPWLQVPGSTGLEAPSALLRIGDHRLRGGDRIIYRREAVR